ncbi:MAG: SAM-dependent methyltransferase [Myxococcales bacterium]|nr:MAG: SAM-dependent methyltransferase [Myxococcales bacterium]
MLQDAEAPSAPTRVVIQGDALAWLAETPSQPLDAVVTSLPDVSELPQLGPGLEGWKSWFVDAAARLMRWTTPGMPCLFFQSDIRHHGQWVDKAYLVQRAAETVGATLVFHKIVCRHPPGTLTQGRPSYSHLLAFSSGDPIVPKKPSADVLPDAGEMPWSRAMGTRACEAACRFLLNETPARRVVDPFCGKGTVLAVANALGLDALGVELSGKRCRAARKLDAAALASS